MRAPVLLLVACVAAQGLAAGGEDEELYAWTSDGPAWHWVRLSVAGTGVLYADADIAAGTSANVAGGLWLLDAGGAVLRRSTDAAWSADFTQLTAASGTLVLADHVQAAPAPNPGLRFVMPVGPGTYTVVAVFGGDGSGLRGEVRLRSDAGATAGPSATGGEVLFAREYDFDSSLNLGLSLPAPRTTPTEARVVDHGSLALTAGGSVFGAFAGAANLHLDMALVTPKGVQNGQTYYPLDSAGGGAFQFLLRSLVDAAPPGCDALACSRSGAWLLAADVAL